MKEKLSLYFKTLSDNDHVVILESGEGELIINSPMYVREFKKKQLLNGERTFVHWLTSPEIYDENGEAVGDRHDNDIRNLVVVRNSLIYEVI